MFSPVPSQLSHFFCTEYKTLKVGQAQLFLYLAAMRNTSKLKVLLLKFTVSFDMDDDGLFTLLLTDKANNNMQQFEAESYSQVLAKAYSYLLREMKKPKGSI